MLTTLVVDRQGNRQQHDHADGNPVPRLPVVGFPLVLEEVGTGPKASCAFDRAGWGGLGLWEVGFEVLGAWREGDC